MKGSAFLKLAVWLPPRSGLPTMVSVRVPEPCEKSMSASLTQRRLGLAVFSK